MKPKKKLSKTKAPPQRAPDPGYRLLWDIVDAAVRDAFTCHPDYLSGKKPERTVRESINKRVVGALKGYAVDVRLGIRQQQ